MSSGSVGDEQLRAKRQWMVERDLHRRGIRDEQVLRAMESVPRHRFVPPGLVHEAYADYPLSIGEGQTISQPYIVALMTEALRLIPKSSVLEIGTGSGYQSAILAACGAHVWTIERSETLSQLAGARFTKLGIEGIHARVGDGTLGLPSEAPFDRILATGSLPVAPISLLEQLREGGLFVGPIGTLHSQQLLRIEYHRDRPRMDELGACRFVPLIGAEGWTVP